MKTTIKIVMICMLVFIVACQSTNNVIGNVLVYKSEYCGCCSGWGGYMSKKGYNVEYDFQDDLSAIKEQYNIPENMRSCHTAMIEGYFVEGHVPIEAINKLLTEKPDIDGIALPRMPSGSPGMPGSKTETWTIYALKDGKSSVFMTI